MSWQVQEAKARFSELVQKTLDEGPQTVTRHGTAVVVVVSAEEFRNLSEQRPGILEVLTSGPEGDLELPPREVQECEIDW